MLINQLEEILKTNKKAIVKIYSLKYSIELIDDKYIIYPILYSNRKYTYNSLKELFNSYQIYNESIINNLDRISICENE